MKHVLFKKYILVLAIALTQLPVFAAQAGSVSVKNIAEIEVKVVENGKTVLKRTPVVKALPEAEIIYTTTFKNLIEKPVTDIVIDNPVPNDSIYKAGTASGSNAVIRFSIDGGKTYGSPDTLKLKGKDGKERLASASEYTHIRWLYQGALGVGKSSEVGFRTIVK